MRISVVEDEPGTTNFICQGLVEAGYAVALVWGCPLPAKSPGHTVVTCVLPANQEEELSLQSFSRKIPVREAQSSSLAYTLE